MKDSFRSLVLELKPSLRLPQFVDRFTVRATEIFGARAGAMALTRGMHCQTIFLHSPTEKVERRLLPGLKAALDGLLTQRSESVCAGRARDLLGQEVAARLGWRNLAVARLTDSEGELLGVLCLANHGRKLSPSAQSMLQALAGYASVALENSRLFSRIVESRKHWVETIDAITDFIVVHDEESRVVRVNRSLAASLGAEPSELIGVGMGALNSVAVDADTEACPFCHAGMDPNEEIIHPVRERIYLVSTSQIEGGSEEGGGTIHVLKDITDRRETERRYRELFDNLQEGMFFSTPDGRFIEVNDAMVRMLGYSSREELLEIDLQRQLYLSPEHQRRFLAAIEKDGVLSNHEEALRRKDGSIIYTLQNVLAVRDVQGRVVQYRGLMLDITEQKTFQAQLQHERDFNRKILNNTQSMILVLDTAGLVSYANRRCFQAGFRQAELVGRPLVEFVPPSRRAVLFEALEMTLRGQQADNLDLPITGNDGRTGQFSVNLSPMRDEQGNVSSIVVVMTDITDAAMLKAKLVHTEKMAAVGQLVSGVAHEINNPLAAIIGFTDLLLENAAVSEAAKGQLRMVLQEAERTQVIVRNLLSFARQTPVHRRPVQVNDILRQTLKLRAYDFASHSVEVVERLPEDLPEIIGDSHQLQQVFLNILNNAYDAVRENGARGRIEIETGQDGRHIEIIFHDNGPGITNPERIFDPFFTTKEVGKGTGLGLSICYGIVREHGGEILSVNTPGQEGATFVVRLPIAPKAARLTPAKVSA